MANRVSLDADGLKISAPGVNVPTASAANTWFNSAWGSLGLHSTGTVAFNWHASSSTEGTFTQNVNFGKTFASAPLVAFYRVMSSGRHDLLNISTGFFLLFERGDPFDPPYSYCDAYATVFNNRIQFGGGYRHSSSGIRRQPVTIRYEVYEYNL